MGVKIGILLIAILAGCFAEPIRKELPGNEFVDSDLYYHADSSARIVGGTVAADGSVPYMVAMSSGLLVRSFMCGGSIITQRTVMTAAHCIAAAFSWGSLSSSLRVTVGTNRWNSGGQSYAISRNVTHPNYLEGPIKNDIGLLITSTNIVFTQNVAPTFLGFDFVNAGIVCRVAGWGRIRQGGALSATLLELFVTTVDGERCKEEVDVAAAELGFRNPPTVEPHIELCTFHSANHGACNGDSGSALVRVDRQEQVGIVSWGIPCARGAPDMFVRLSAYRSWLEQSIV